jgi:hypothetical protein
MQVTQNSGRDLWSSQGHCGADADVEHPCWQGCYNTRLNLDMDDATAGALLAVMNPYAVTVVGMPAVMNYNFMPNMGRMTA